MFFFARSSSVIAFCHVGSGDTLWPSGTLRRRHVFSSWHSATGRRRVMRARPVFGRSRASGMGANAVDKTSTFVGVFQNKRALLLVVVKGLNICWTESGQKPDQRCSQLSGVQGTEEIWKDVRVMFKMRLLAQSSVWPCFPASESYIYEQPCQRHPRVMTP